MFQRDIGTLGYGGRDSVEPHGDVAVRLDGVSPSKGVISECAFCHVETLYIEHSLGRLCYLDVLHWGVCHDALHNGSGGQAVAVE